MAENFNREGNINKAEDSAIIGDMKARTSGRKAVRRTNRFSGAAEAVVPARKPATLGKVAGTLRKVTEQSETPIKIYQSKPESTTLPLGSEGFESKFKTEKFFQQFKGLSQAEIDAHRTAGTFAKKASSPEEEQKFYSRAIAISKGGTSKTAQRKVDKKIAETGGMGTSKEPISAADYEAESKLNTINTPLPQIYAGPNVNSAAATHIEDLHRIATTIDGHARIAGLPDNHPVFKKLSEVYDHIGNAYTSHWAGDSSGRAGQDATAIKGRGKGADLGIETSTLGSVGHAREATVALGQAGRALAAASPKFNEIGGAQETATRASRTFNKYKRATGDTSGSESFDFNQPDGRLFPNHTKDTEGEALAGQSHNAYDLTRESFKRGGRRVDSTVNTSGASAFATGTPTRRGPAPEPTEGRIAKDQGEFKPSTTPGTRNNAKDISSPLVGAFSPEEHAKSQAAWAENAIRTRGSAAAASTRGATSGYTGEARYKTYGTVNSTGEVRGYEKPTPTKGQAKKIAKTMDAAEARTHFYSQQRAELGGEKEFAKQVKKNPELQGELQTKFNQSLASKKPSAYLESVGKPSRSSVFKTATGK